MRIIRHRTGNRIKAALMVVLSVLLVGLIPLQAAYAASSEVSIDYQQKWTNKSGETVDDTFEYRLTRKTGGPLPAEATGDFYSFAVKGNQSGSIKLHFPFTSPGYYHYLVQAYIPEKKAHYSYDETVYDLMIMVVNSDSGLEVGAMTLQIEGSDDDTKFEKLYFSHAYTKDNGGGNNPGRNDPGGGDDPGGGGDDPGGGDDSDGGNHPGGGDNPGGGNNPGDNNPGGGNNGGGNNGGNGGGTTIAQTNAGTAAADGTDEAELPTTIDELETPKSIIPDVEHWALLNLILMILAVVTAVADAALYFKDPKDKYGEDYENREIHRHGTARIITIIPAAVSALVFMLTEDITEQMEWVDQYTIWMLILFVATSIMAVMSKKEIGGDDGDGDDLHPELTG